ncbi:MAG: TolC family protein [Clostridium sp.]|jgi:hypothetical protein
MKYINRKISAAFSMALSLSLLLPEWALAASPPFAYSEEKWAALQDNKLEFDEIADLISEYNSTVTENRLAYQDYRGKDSDEIAQEYYDAADEIEAGIEYPDTDDANYGSRLAAAQSSEASARQMREKGDENVSDSDVILWGYTKTEKSLVQTAQKQMISYWKAVKTLETSENSVQSAQADYEAILIKASAGSATESDVLNAKETLLNAQAAVEEAKDSIESTRETLCMSLGWNYGDGAEIGQLPEPQENMSASVSLEADMEKALEQNYDLRILERKAHNAMESTLKEQYQTSLEAGRETVKSSVQSAWQSLVLAETQYDQARRALELEKKTKETMDLKLAAGLVSRMEASNETYSLTEAGAQMETASMGLLEAQLNYQWAVNGLASAS